MLVDPLSDQYPTDEALLQFLDNVEREALAVPGVARLAWSSDLPYRAIRERPANMFIEIVGDPTPAESQRPTAGRQMVSPTYFQTLDQPLVSGRAFDVRDTKKSPPVCIVNEAFVQRYLRRRNPIGMRIAVRPMSQPRSVAVQREIVGVARQVRSRPDEKEPLVQLYVPMAQNVVGDIYLLVRPASGDAGALVSGVRGAIARIDREQLVSVREIHTIENLTWIANERQRFRALMVMTFAGLALALAMVGVFGIVGYAVEQRLREVAVRRALGATTADVLGLVIGRIAPVFAVGLVAGLGLAAALGQTLSTVLVGVDPLDPLTFATAGGVLTLVGLVALAGPARRAIRVDPATALRL
jgi:putative ABC transport system permease protein